MFCLLNLLVLWFSFYSFSFSVELKDISRTTESDIITIIFPKAFVWMPLTDSNLRLKYSSNLADLGKRKGSGRME